MLSLVTHTGAGADRAVDPCRVRRADQGDSRPPPLKRWGTRTECDPRLRPAAWIPKNPRLARLAEQIRKLQADRRPPSHRCASGLPGLDDALGGGFALASLHELLAPLDGGPAESIALLTAARAAGEHRWIIYIDARGDFYPPGAVQLGVPLGRLLVIQVSRHAEVLWVSEQALRCRAVGAVILPVRRIDRYVSRRLQLAAENGGGLGLVIQSEPRPGHTFAASRLRLDPLVGEAETRRALVSVLKLREGRPVEPFVVELPDAAGALPAHAGSGDRAGQARRAIVGG
jgi:protein ImuA